MYVILDMFIARNIFVGQKKNLSQQNLVRKTFLLDFIFFGKYTNI